MQQKEPSQSEHSSSSEFARHCLAAIDELLAALDQAPPRSVNAQALTQMIQRLSDLVDAARGRGSR